MIVLGRCTHCGRWLGEETADAVEGVLHDRSLAFGRVPGPAADNLSLVLVFFEACGVDWRRSPWGVDPSRSALPALDAVEPRSMRLDGSFLSWFGSVLFTVIAAGTAGVDAGTRPGDVTAEPWSVDDRGCIRLALVEVLFDLALSDDRPLAQLRALDRAVADAAHGPAHLGSPRAPRSIRSQVLRTAL